MSGGAKGLRGHILLSHTHWDHIQGIPFFYPLFAPGNEWDIYGPRSLGQSLRETLGGQMQYTYFPVPLDQCRANIRYHDLVEGTFDIDDIKVCTQYLNHPALTLGYRLEADGATVVYACDHEPYSRTLATGDGEITGQDLRHAQFVNRADLLIHDAQYTAEEYPAKVGWGHSSIEYVLNLGQYAQVKRIALTHHDPLRDDDAIDCLIANAQEKLRQNASSLDLFAALEGQVVEVAPSGVKGFIRGTEEFQAKRPIEPALAKSSVILGIADTKLAATLSETIRAEGIHTKFFANIDEARALIAKARPSVAILEHDPPYLDGMEMCHAIRAQENDHQHQLPVVMVAAEENQAAGGAAGVTDWLIRPFTDAHARTKISAWALRAACQRIRVVIPQDENGRLTRPPVHIRKASMAQRGIENKRFSKNVISTDKSDLLWMYCREIAPFETPAFSKAVGDLVARSARRPSEMRDRSAAIS
jgi:phosphoribosyl 1,2-cyclic phosphodiesterase/DNA-binding response OmpR family regulator